MDCGGTSDDRYGSRDKTTRVHFPKLAMTVLMQNYYFTSLNTDEFQPVAA